MFSLVYSHLLFNAKVLICNALNLGEATSDALFLLHQRPASRAHKFLTLSNKKN
jgi:hypothetical protein